MSRKATARGTGDEPTDLPAKGTIARARTSCRGLSGTRTLPGVLLAVISVTAPGLSGCGDPGLRQIRETYELVGGDPRIDPALPSVDIQQGAGQVASAAPLQLDSFLQQPVGKVDILWVIDNSQTMKLRQAQVRENFRHFIDELVARSETIDYQLGVVTTDTYVAAESGRLRHPAGFARPWISSTNCVAPACDPVAEFEKLADVGTLGSGDEKGLLAAQLALTPPLMAPGGANDGFVRPDASLVVIVLSDEEDSSCAPARKEYGGGCGFPPAYDHVEWGGTDYYVRLFNGLKGFGGEHLVKVTAIVATQPEEEYVERGESEDVVRYGCGVGGERAIHAPRYLEVAERTGGQTISICQSDYGTVLRDLAGGVSGARVAFPLARRPFEDSIRVFVTPQGGTRSATTKDVEWSYTGCTSGTFANVVRFASDHVPPPMSTVEIEYAVNVREPGCHAAP